GLRRVTRRTIDAGRSFTLMQSWLERGEVEYIFVDYRLQQPLYEYARDVAKVPAAKLEAWFQYPRGRRARTGIIRHLRGHADHLHVRFWAPGSRAAAKAYIAKYGTKVLKPVPVYRKVRRGDSLWKIARRYKTSVKKLKSWNRMGRRSLLQPGQKLITGWRAPSLPSP
ncbi:MAG: LysM peptidoglycan-binding domain-containing protein, partial [Myxococcales bacterium]|nr:LysM peptidoglycan-binding domain-containing protein [Myxococcales bacterium]